MKKCNKCGEVKKLGEFYTDNSKKDGLHTICIECIKKYNSDNYKQISKKQKARCRTIKGKYNSLTAAARERKQTTSITFEQYKQLLAKNECYYCDESLEGAAGHSLNRINSSKGYMLENVRPCCRICNKIMNNFTKEQITSRIYKLAKRMD